MVAVIIACEIGFWVLLVAGLAARYVLRARRVSTALLLAVPAVDVVLLAVALIDLLNGGEADPAHGLAAVYIGTSVAFGAQMIGWADQRFAHRFAGGPPPVKPPRTGPEHAARERRQWTRHLLAYVIGAAVLGVFTALAGDLDRVRPLWSVLGVWTLVLVIDFMISFSYTLFPRRR
ncbi:hypothetical protein ACIA5D_18110 [Actinoplanes sp. NPDC051513]|uniref:hypothetical protein n=1 Tax=Actinoplanes sp. NPDC051513 TaxID=3363908 RepID=UPI0037B06F07